MSISTIIGRSVEFTIGLTIFIISERFMVSLSTSPKLALDSNEDTQIPSKLNSSTNLAVIASLADTITNSSCLSRDFLKEFLLSIPCTILVVEV